MFSSRSSLHHSTESKSRDRSSACYGDRTQEQAILFRRARHALQGDGHPLSITHGEVDPSRAAGVSRPDPRNSMCVGLDCECIDAVKNVKQKNLSPEKKQCAAVLQLFVASETLVF
jgi:hypothetical protein